MMLDNLGLFFFKFPNAEGNPPCAQKKLSEFYLQQEGIDTALKKT